MKWSTTHILFNYLCYFRSCASPSAYRRSYCPEVSNRIQAILTSDLWRTSTPSTNCGLGPRKRAHCGRRAQYEHRICAFTFYIFRALLACFVSFSRLDSPSGSRTVPVGLGLLTVEGPRSHSDTPHSVRLLWTSDQPVAQTSTWQHKGKHSFSRRYSNPQSQQANGRSPTQPPRPALLYCVMYLQHTAYILQ